MKRFLLHALCIAPAVWIGYDALTGGLGFNPVEQLDRRTGRVALVLLLVTLASTPVAMLAGKKIWPPRKIVGRYGYLYAVTHLLIFLGVDYGFRWSYLADAIGKKPYALAGLAALAVMTPRAVTSFRLDRGKWARWYRTINRAVHGAVAVGVLHYFWAVKGSKEWPMLAAGVLLTVWIFRWGIVRLRRSG